MLLTTGESAAELCVTALFGGAAAAFFVAFGGCAALRAFSVRRKLLDQPNERSLHTTPVPRLGGVAIVAAVSVAVLIMVPICGRRLGRLELSWLASSLPIAGLGLLDDLRALRASTRLLLQVLAASAFCVIAGVPHCIPLHGDLCIALPTGISFVLWVLLIVTFLNIFNFMDGMDGLAGTQASGAAIGIGISFLALGHVGLASICVAVASAALGFLLHNAPPARIFMGDAGSTFLGFTFGALAMLGADVGRPVPTPVFLLALAPFLLDGTSTIMRRVFRGEQVWKAHRSHLYQRAVTAGRTHSQVLVVYAAWIVVAVASASTIHWARPPMFVALALVTMGVLGVVWVWVVRLERDGIQRGGESVRDQQR
jgi:Fuc2NAc and GlcNAc transferase